MQKTPFLRKGRELQLRLCTIPQHVSAVENPDSESYDQIVKRQDNFLTMPKNIKFKLASSDTGQKIQAIGQKYGFELLRLANITRLVREYYFGEVAFEDFPSEIERRVGVSPFTAQEITRYLKQEIIDWDPWAEYVARLPKIPVREMIERKLKIADTEITAGYVELRGSEDLEDPTIKNWIQDYVSHLGYGKHSQMDRTQYLFHSENGKNLSSPDREKLGIILKSFDENIPLPVDEENGEVVFDGLIEKNPPPAPPFSKGERPIQNFPLSQRGIKGDFEKAENKQDSFIKPYSPVQQPQRQTLPSRQTSSPPSPPAAKIPYKTTTSDPEINKYFNTPELPEIKIHSMTEHNEPPARNPAWQDSNSGKKVAPQRPNVPRPVPSSPPPASLREQARLRSQPAADAALLAGVAGGSTPEGRPKYKIIDPFEPRIIEPKIDGNIVDLSGGE